MRATVPTGEEFDALLARVEALEAQLAAPTNPPEWLTVKAAADYTGLTEDAIRKLVDRRGVPKNQEVAGGRILLRRTDLDAALARNPSHATP